MWILISSKRGTNDLPFPEMDESRRCYCSSEILKPTVYTHPMPVNTHHLPFLRPSSFPQEKACFHFAERSGDDAAGRAPRDPQHCQRLWVQQRSRVPGPGALFRRSHHFRGALRQPGSAPPRHDGLQLVLRAPSEAKPQDKECGNSSTCGEPECGRHKQNSQRRVVVAVAVRTATTNLLQKEKKRIHVDHDCKPP